MIKKGNKREIRELKIDYNEDLVIIKTKLSLKL